ncbi:hypothetical protein C8Q72DRAFT_791109 [Fomitopsis betulina]|nr:hypothetical protein C8Q72DRAFT_796475 [Fomitopsis betulina]KAI0736739.1 hypothetical protein C8Q72DRAFT_791109 [Fomitopsis betulina]
MSGEEYEVESIQQAKVITTGRSRKKEWIYFVKWKNYDMRDNTWEPPSSFGGSEHFIDKFWGRVTIGERDWRDISQFKTGEVVFPTGPPRRHATLSGAESSEESEDEVKSIIADDEGRPKRKRRLSDAVERASPKRRRGRKSIPQDDERQAVTPARSARHKRSVPDLTSATTSQKKPSAPASTKRKPRAARRLSTDAFAEQEIEQELQYPSEPSSPDGAGRSGWEESTGAVPSAFGAPLLLQDGRLPEAAALAREPTASLPPHRARAAKPKVQRYEDPILGASEASGSAIGTKARLMRRNGDQQDSPQADKTPVRNGARSTRVPGTKAGPGRSSSGLITGGRSLLTAAGGALKSVTRKVIRSGRVVQPTEVEELSSGADAEGEPDPAELPALPPTGEELLHQAGYSAADAQNLSNFEDDVDAHDVGKMKSTVPEPEAKPETVSREDHEAREAPVEREVVGSSFRPWRASIFGPLGLGVEEAPATAQHEERTEDKSATISSETSTNHLFLALDYATSIPVRLKDVYPPASQLESLTSQPNNNPPGKFYKSEHALPVLQAFRTEGSTARLILDPGADELHRAHFARFCSRLHAGELFIEMIGVKLLATYSSENRQVGERLGAPANLVGLSETVLVAQVAIENQLAYVDAIAYADNSQWSAS